MWHAVLASMGAASVIGLSGSEDAMGTEGADTFSFQPKPLDDDWFKCLVGEWVNPALRSGS